MRTLPRLLAAALLCAGSSAAAQSAKPPAAAPASPVPGVFGAPEFVMGSPRAKVTVVEYLSNTCSHCADFDIKIFPGLKAAYVDKGKVRWIVREMVTPPEQVSAAGFVFARCGGPAKYWPTLEALFRAQPELFRTGDVKGTYGKIAAAEGIAPARLEQCMNDEAAFNALGARVEAAEKAGVEATPTFVFNGRMLKPGEALGGATYGGGELTPAMFAAAYARAGGR